MMENNQMNQEEKLNLIENRVEEVLEENERLREENKKLRQSINSK